MHDLRF